MRVANGLCLHCTKTGNDRIEWGPETAPRPCVEYGLLVHSFPARFPDPLLDLGLPAMRPNDNQGVYSGAHEPR